MTSVTVVFLDGSVHTFTAIGGVAVQPEQFWVRIEDTEGKPVAAVPREQVKFWSTSFAQ